MALLYRGSITPRTFIPCMHQYHSQSRKYAIALLINWSGEQGTWERESSINQPN